MLQLPRSSGLLMAALFSAADPAVAQESLVGADEWRSTTAEALFDPPNCTNGAELFSDVDSADPFCEWVEQLANDGIATGCTAGPGGRFCPDDPVTRKQLAMFLERSMRGTATWSGGPTVIRSIPVPLTSLVDCEVGGYLSFTNSVTGSAPQFLFAGAAGVTVLFDADAGEEDEQHRICTRLVIPSDYVAGTQIVVFARAESITPSLPAEVFTVTLVGDDGTTNACNLFLPNAAGITDLSCASGNFVAAGRSAALMIRALGSGGTMNDGVQLYGIELRYTSVQ